MIDAAQLRRAHDKWNPRSLAQQGAERDADPMPPAREAVELSDLYLAPIGMGCRACPPNASNASAGCVSYKVATTRSEARTRMTRGEKKVLYVIAAGVGFGLVIGTAGVFTVLLAPVPVAIPFVVSLWLAIIGAIATVVRNYKNIGNGPPGTPN